MLSVTSCLTYAKRLSLTNLDAELLLSFVLKRANSFIYTYPDYPLNPKQSQYYFNLCQQRAAGLPAAWLLGSCGFWTLQLATCKGVFVPRPDTETLVTTALEINLPARARVVELGSGSGAIALALASERPDWHITGVERSHKALQLARQNQQQLGMKQVRFTAGDWFSCLRHKRFDMCIANPPYLAHSERIRYKDVRYEPVSALYAGSDGLRDFKRIIKGAMTHLKRKGWIVFEHGWRQADNVTQLLKQHHYRHIKTIKDLNGHPRVTFAQLS